MGKKLSCLTIELAPQKLFPGEMLDVFLKGYVYA